jgi:hypothetical protein
MILSNSKNNNNNNERIFTIVRSNLLRENNSAFLVKNDCLIQPSRSLSAVRIIPMFITPLKLSDEIR